MAYPDDIDSYRDKENLPGLVFDADDKKTFFVEDIQAVENSVIAIETALGVGLENVNAIAYSYLQSAQQLMQAFNLNGTDNDPFDVKPFHAIYFDSSEGDLTLLFDNFNADIDYVNGQYFDISTDDLAGGDLILDATGSAFTFVTGDIVTISSNAKSMRFYAKEHVFYPFFTDETPIPDASTSAKGIVQLTGDLGGTATAPTTPTAVHVTGNETIAGNKTIIDKVFFPTTSSTVPSIAFTDDTNLGIARSNNNTMSFISNGVEMSRYGSAATFNVQVRPPNGSNTSPSVAFGPSYDTGVYRPASGKVGIAAGGTKIVEVTSSGLEVIGALQADSIRIDQTPTSETITPTHTFTVSLNGTNYKIPVVAA